VRSWVLIGDWLVEGGCMLVHYAAGWDEGLWGLFGFEDEV
jgi:hypothetical protein